ncbi:FmdB family zinc ribbon protein [Pseudodesulfovibrio tunisiensis]|uniref:FmdB family zinc ribbon protein n=1 Tax=Pseudodesulfovibrio tunisiensis TaxID=463192 RepID=UPI001FB1B9B7|nr:zinc ribbon domain-containing protein [Pseudodesulfovibrio tunisiensis]
MPIYEYQCEKCGRVFEDWQSGFEEHDMECPDCGGVSRRLISNTSFILKGSGWYVTDYAGKNPSNGASGSGDNGNGNGKKDAAASKAKPDTGGCAASASTTSAQ